MILTMMFLLRTQMLLEINWIYSITSYCQLMETMLYMYTIENFIGIQSSHILSQFIMMENLI